MLVVQNGCRNLIIIKSFHSDIFFNISTYLLPAQLSIRFNSFSTVSEKYKSIRAHKILKAVRAK